MAIFHPSIHLGRHGTRFARFSGIPTLSAAFQAYGMMASFTSNRRFLASSVPSKPQTKLGSSEKPIMEALRKPYPDFCLRDKVYVVTGGGGGLGLVLAEAMMQGGAHGNLLQFFSSR